MRQRQCYGKQNLCAKLLQNLGTFQKFSILWARLLVIKGQGKDRTESLNNCYEDETQGSMAVVKFIFEDKSKAPKVVKAALEGLSLLDIAEENDVHLSHNCGGVCACSTCHVYIEKGEEFLEGISEKEEDFIDRAINPRLESRLGCQCIILDESAELEVQIPDQSRIIGHEH